MEYIGEEGNNQEVPDCDVVNTHDPNHLKKYHTRLDTFKSWQKRVPSKVELARAGFFYLKYSDRVQCAWCGLQLHNWVGGDIPMEEHVRWNQRRRKDCEFVKMCYE